MDRVDFKHIVFVQFGLLHYQIPRMQSLADACNKLGILFTSIELSGYVQDYPWVTGKETTQFSNIILFPEEDYKKINQKQLWIALRSKLEEVKPDVLFVGGYSLAVMRQMKTWADKQNLATVLLSDSNIFDKKRYPLFEFLKSLFVSKFDGAFVGGTSSGQYIQSLGIPSSRIKYGLDVIDTSLFERRSDENRKKEYEVRQRWNLPKRYFLFVGRLIKEKNIPMMLSAYARYCASQDLRSEAWNLVICGSGPQEPEIKDIVQSLPEQTRAKIHLCGHINQPEIIDFFTFASCFLLPSISESWGLVINEALSCGLPVIVSNKSGCAQDLVIHQKNGWVFNPNNIDELFDWMIHITNLEETSSDLMGENGKKLISEWGLARFAQGAIEIAEIAYQHRKQKTISQPYQS